MSRQIVTRAFNFEVRAGKDEKNGTYIEGRPIVYNSRTNLGCFDEIIEVGALDKTNLKDVRFLVNHNTKMIPLARSRNNNENSTMQLKVDDKGMKIRVNLDVENNTDARNLYSAVSRGDITGMSFMFAIDENGDAWEELKSNHPTRRIKEFAEIFEVSAVTFPAYESTEISARDKLTLESARKALDSARSRSLDSDAVNLELEKAKNRNRLIYLKLEEKK